MGAPNAYLQRLVDERASAWEQAKNIMATAAGESRDLTAEEDETLTRLNGVIDANDARVKTLLEAEERAAAADEVRSRVGALFASAPERTSGHEADPGQILRTMVRTRNGEAEFRADPRIFAFAGGESRALANFATSLVPTLFANSIIVYARTLNPTLGLATVINSTSGEPITFPRLTADLTAYTPGEGTAITPADPTLSTVTLTVVGYKALTLLSQELAQDEGYGIEDYIARSAGRQIGLDSGAEFTTGTTGFITLGSNGGTAAGTPFFTATDLITLQYGLAAPYRAVGAWQMSNSALQKARKWTDTNGQFLWQPSLAAGQPDTILGRPVYENPAMATAASASKSVAFGDFSAYMVKALPLRVETSKDYLFNTDQVAVKVVLRTGGTLPDAAAVKYLVSANT